MAVLTQCESKGAGWGYCDLFDYHSCSGDRTCELAPMTCLGATPLCDATNGGCKPCTPNTAVCVGWKRAVCDASGQQTLEHCASGPCRVAGCSTTAVDLRRDTGYYSSTVYPTVVFSDGSVIRISARASKDNKPDTVEAPIPPDNAVGIITNSTETAYLLNDGRIVLGTQTFLSGVKQASSGRPGSHACAVKVDGTVWCWGRNTNGELGIGTTQGMSNAVQVHNVSDAEMVTVGGDCLACNLGWSCALTKGGAVYCWGANSSGQLGDGTTQEKWEPEVASPATVGAAWIGAGDCASSASGQMFAIMSDGTAKRWGYFMSEVGGSTSVPKTIPGLSNVKALSGTSRSICAVSNSGQVLCWGKPGNSSQQVGFGDGTTTWPGNSPTLVPGVANAIDVFVFNPSSTSVCALIQGGSILCWGVGSGHQVGPNDSGTQLEVLEWPVPFEWP
jgi:hypothetical protein